jgi:RNA polymerase sigma factor (sigma-70 family)
MISRPSIPKNYTEAEIISQIREGNSSLYEILIRRNNPYLYKIGRSYGYSHHDTEDLMQETLVKAYYALSTFEERSTFRTWLTRIMLNECYHKKRKQRSQKEIYTHQPQEHMSTGMKQPIPSIISRELGKVIEQALQELPEEYRMVFTLRELNGHSTLETAELLNMSEANIKTRLSRAKAMMRKVVEKHYSAEELFEFNLIYCDRIVEKVMQRIR